MMGVSLFFWNVVDWSAQHASASCRPSLIIEEWGGEGCVDLRKRERVFVGLILRV